jgi:hypothetical protein
VSQHRRFVQGDVIGLVALDFILRLVRGGMVYVTFVVDVTSVHFDDFPAHPSGFRISTHVIAYLERLDHLRRFSQFSALPPAEKQKEYCDEGQQEAIWDNRRGAVLVANKEIKKFDQNEEHIRTRVPPDS